MTVMTDYTIYTTTPIADLITDRTASDIINRVPFKCAGDYNMLNRIECACLYLSDCFGMELVCKHWDMDDWRLTSEMTRIRSNIVALRTAYSTRGSTGRTPDSFTLDSYSQANTIEQILKDIGELFENTVSAMMRLHSTTHMGGVAIGNRR